MLNPKLGSFNKVHNFVLCQELGIKGILYLIEVHKTKGHPRMTFFLENYGKKQHILCGNLLHNVIYIYILQVGIADKSNPKREFGDCHGT